MEEGKDEGRRNRRKEDCGRVWLPYNLIFSDKPAEMEGERKGEGFTRWQLLYSGSGVMEEEEKEEEEQE
ncbi:hypothetical protein E2C01_035984 [Portunus trituberculatus]|uniref:Uncharacterized protein n=1 Tax=Portunus trituberculatus TaxID=210409 RepID=A0A5B7FB73_PORTR|nr:hypothetical protein [Portunus trituberculatus]